MPFNLTENYSVESKETKEYRKLIFVLCEDWFHIFYMHIRCKVQNKSPCIQQYQVEKRRSKFKKKHAVT